MRQFLLAAAVAASLPCAGRADDAEPSKGSVEKKPSEIIAAVEGRPDYLRLVDMSWNDNGYYEIEYRTRDKAKVEINIDAKSGLPVDPDEG